MSQSKKPVILVGLGLGGLILLPVLFWAITQIGGKTVPSEPGNSVSESGGPVATSYELEELASVAKGLLEEDLARALQEGDVTLDFVAALTKEANRADSDARSGRIDRARERYESVVQQAKAELEKLKLTAEARTLRDSIFNDLARLKDLRGAFSNTYEEAVAAYDAGQRALETREYAESMVQFELASGILSDLETRAAQRKSGLLESAEQALESHRFDAARQAYEAVLAIESSNEEARQGLATVEALEGIHTELKAARALIDSGKLDDALLAFRALAQKYPDNDFIQDQLSALENKLLDREITDLIKASRQAEAAGDIATAIDTLEQALALKNLPEQAKRLQALKDMVKAQQLEALLADGFDALRGGRYESARAIYKEATELDGESKEAQTGLEKASSLYLASIRYSQKLDSAKRTMEEGRFPLAAKLFNDAMRSRPAQVTPSQESSEVSIRDELERQSVEVPVTLKSDGRTYVSIIGVLPPERFKSKDLLLFPDVYKIRGTRNGYRDVERELRVDATKPKREITIECTIRQ